MIKTFKTKNVKPCWGISKPFILASSSPRRIRLLENAGFKPAETGKQWPYWGSNTPVTLGKDKKTWA